MLHEEYDLIYTRAPVTSTAFSPFTTTDHDVPQNNLMDNKYSLLLQDETKEIYPGGNYIFKLTTQH